MKKFKSYDEQINILHDRNVTIDDDNSAKKFLQMNNYYNVVNGYKDLFVASSNKGEDLYKNGTNFNEIKALYLFDRALRNIFLEYLLIFENSLKSLIGYEFSKKYRSKNAYFMIENFDSSNPKAVMKQISIIARIISNKISNEGPIKHYVDAQSSIPFWVLINYFTFGNVSHFYNILDNELRINIAKYYTDEFDKDHNFVFNKSIKLHQEQISSIIKVSTIVRNICAHDERLFSTKIQKVKISNIYRYFSIDCTSNNDKLFTLIVLLKCVLSREDYTQFIFSISDELDILIAKCSTISKLEIMNKMGLPDNWKLLATI